MKKIVLSESEKKAIITKREQAILESFAKTFNKIKRLDENEVNEVYYDTLKPVEGYVDADDIIGKSVWIHTNFTHKNQGKNGMVGMYPPNNKGYRTGSPIGYTNDIRLGGGLVFEQSESGAANVARTQIKQLIAGVSGIIIPTDSGNTSGMELVTYNAKAGLGYFHLVNDSTEIPRKIIGADEVYLNASELGKYSFYVKNPIFNETEKEKEGTQLKLNLNETDSN